MDVRIETIGPIQVARIRHVGPYAEVGTCFERLFRWVSVSGAPTGRVLALCRDESEAVPARPASALPARLACKWP